MKKSTNPRWIALQVMLDVIDNGRSLDDICIHNRLQSLASEPRDLAFCRELVFGLCRWYFVLSKQLASRLQKPLRERDRDIEIMLLLGLYQLLIMKKEQHAAVNETVQLAQLQKKIWAKPLINGLLRKSIREGVELDDQARLQSYPPWMRARIERDWGTQAEQLLHSGNDRAPMILRVDTRHLDLTAAIQRLNHAGFAASPIAQVNTAVRLDTPCEAQKLPGFAEGLFSVQDAAAQIAAPLLGCEPGTRVLDACAAPGGKTAHLLQCYESIEVDALDLSETRSRRIGQNLQRIGKTAKVLIGDAREPERWFAGEDYDYILADVPCSATGVLRRHPDIKLLRRESDIQPLMTQQLEILDALWLLLKPGGKLLYSTCSVFKDENETQIARFLQRHAECAEVPIRDVLWGDTRPHGRQILTGQCNMDGFYYALLTKHEGNEAIRH